MRWIAALTVLLALGGCGHGAAAPPATVVMATTTSTNDTGLLDRLMPAFARASGIQVRWVSVGTGQALALGEKGDADLVLVHAREREDAFVAAGHGTERRDVMWNDFLIVGPAADPAGVKGARAAAEALERIAAAGAGFVSRGDDSGTHAREQALWKAGGGRPDWPGHVETGQGMGHTLMVAHERQAYVLADRGTWLAFRRRVDLVALVEGDRALTNPYGAIVVNPARRPGGNAAGAQRLLDWLVAPEGQAAIAAFQVDGEALFRPGSPGD